MALVFKTLHRASTPDALNEEWMLLENVGPNPVNTKGCAITIAKPGKQGQRPRSLGTLDPGFILHPKEKIRLVTGSPAKKAQGAPPDGDDIKNYHLFLMEPVLAPGVTVRVAHNQMILAVATFSADAKDGLTPAKQ